MIPTIKKEVTKFLLSERGTISKNNLIKLGVLALSAAAFSAMENHLVMAGHANRSQHVSADCQAGDYTPLDGYGSPHKDLTMGVSCHCDGTLFCSDNCNVCVSPGHCSGSHRNAPSGWLRNHSNHENGDDECFHATLDFNDVVMHQNSLDIFANNQDSILATHSHSIANCRTDVDIQAIGFDDHGSHCDVGPSCSCNEVCTQFVVRLPSSHVSSCQTHNL